MKKTTKILIGLGIGIPLHFIGLLIYLSTLPTEEISDRYGFSDDPYVSQALQPAHTVDIDGQGTGWDYQYKIYVKPISDAVPTPQLRIPVELQKYIKASEKDGVLSITLADVNELLKEKQTHHLDMHCTLYLDTATLREIRSREKDTSRSAVEITIEDWRTHNTLTCSGNNSNFILRNGCQLPKLHVTASRYLELRGSTIDTLSLQLDHIEGWTVHECNIKVEQLYATGNVHVFCPRSEADRVEWYPQSEHAGLHIRLSADPVVIEYTEPKR